MGKGRSGIRKKIDRNRVKNYTELMTGGVAMGGNERVFGCKMLLSQLLKKSILAMDNQ